MLCAAQALCAVVRIRENVVRRVVRKALCAQGLDEQINAQHKSVVRFEVHNSDQFGAQGFLRWHKQKMLCRIVVRLICSVKQTVCICIYDLWRNTPVDHSNCKGLQL